jgi:hypothetical protein
MDNFGMEAKQTSLDFYIRKTLASVGVEVQKWHLVAILLAIVPLICIININPEQEV